MAKKASNGEANYSATIKEASRELTAKERVMFKDTSNATKLNEFVTNMAEAEMKPIITVKDYVVLSIHNEASEDVDYDNYVIVDKDGNKYYTGSTAFWNKFKSIWDEMKDETEEWGIEVTLIPSKKYTGKTALSCALV